MSPLSHNLQNVLKQTGYSLTKARNLVFSSLQNQEPQTMNQLIAACGSAIDRASVYRTVALFEKLGIVQRLQIGWKYKLELSDSFHIHHHHLTCNNCGTIAPLHEDPELENRLLRLASGESFTPTSHQIEIRGLCHPCSIPK